MLFCLSSEFTILLENMPEKFNYYYYDYYYDFTGKPFFAGLFACYAMLLVRGI